MFTDLSHRYLAVSLLRRQLESRYKGSLLGMGWLMLFPIVMLSVYTLVFDSFLKVRWPDSPAPGGIDTALNIYLGLLIVQFISENVVAAPNLVLQNIQFVKKITFPLPILAYIATASALVPMLFGLILVAVLSLMLPGTHPERLLWLGIFWLPVIILGLAANWWLGALGVFVRDLPHIVGPFLTALMFLSPVFYSTRSLPKPWNEIMHWNPLSGPIESARVLLFTLDMPDFSGSLVSLAGAIVLGITGRWVFDVLNKGFADVL